MTTKLNFVSCVLWIRQGVAKEFPDKFRLTQDEIRTKIENDRLKYKELKRSNNNNNGDDRMDIADDDDQEIIDRYNLDDYDDDDDVENMDDYLLLSANAATENDPYINREQTYSDEENENDDFRIKNTDNLLLAGHVEEDSVSLEIKIYNQIDNMYVHHEIYLAAYPLCFEWLNYKNSNELGNFVAVGDMNNDINIWNIDIVDVIDPQLILKGHKKSVLDLSWNESTTNILASSSADKKCLIWDLETNKILQTFNEFKSSIQSISFNGENNDLLLTGDSNGNVKLFNYKQQLKSFRTINVCKNEIEKVLWNYGTANEQFLCATSDGHIYGYDYRNDSKNLFNINAHNEMITGMEFSSSLNNDNRCLMTTSADEMVKIWSLSNNNNRIEPKLIQTIQPNIGTILSLSANPNYSNIFAISGDNNSNDGENLKIIDLNQYPLVKQCFNGF